MNIDIQGKFDISHAGISKDRSVEAGLQAKLAAETDRANQAEARSTELRKKLSEVEKELKASRGKVGTYRRVFIVQKGELDLAHDRYAELKRRHDALRKDHEELLEAVKQAAREERRLAAEPPQTGAAGGEGWATEAG